MTIAANTIAQSYANKRMGWATKLDEVGPTAKEVLGVIREDQHPVFGPRKFQYVCFYQASGATVGQLQSYVDPVSVADITSGTTTVITTSGLTAGIYDGGLLVCIDDAGGSGAAPEGESGVIVENTTTTITIATADAFSVAPAANDDFNVLLPWAVDDSADGDMAHQVAGVVMGSPDQYDYGWVQFFGINPNTKAVAAGTALIVNELVVADTATVNDGAGDADNLSVGVLKVGLTSDTVARNAVVDLFCGQALKLGTSTA